MTRHVIALLVAGGLASAAMLVVVSVPVEVAAANKAHKNDKKPILNPKFDPQAEQVDLFDAVEAGNVTVKLISQDAMGGNVLIENKTDKPLTVKIPDAVVGVSIHSQLANFGMGNLAGANNGLGKGANTQMQGGVVGMNQGMNNNQNQFPGNNNGNNGMGNFPPNFFSIPAEKVISLTFNSVCIEHGKPEPDSTRKYTLIPVSRFSKDPVLYQLLATVGKGTVDSQAAQAAVWHLTDKMSFQDLAQEMTTAVGGQPSVPYFTREQLKEAKELLTQATERAAKQNADVKIETERTVTSR